MMVQFDVKRVQKGTESFMVSFDFNKTPITQIADYIIIAAAKYGSSDIHFDPRDNGMMVRFRIDGDCQDYTFVPKAYERNLSTRLKLMANMNITESRLPQDGAIKGNFGDQYLDMRVSSLPLNEGEKIVIRILDYSRSLQGVDTLGFHPKNLEKIKRMMELPNGIILTTGATGSGKSTTTYSILQGLNRTETNIITVEDPIEMNIEGINQVQVNSEIGMTFAAALRSILRQDPNIILIGEIRDSETAQIAVRASITGHLVLSTIHTNNALATVERLLDMDVERYLLSTALSGIISQRLAKTLCQDCRYQRDTTKYEKKIFKKYMKMDVARIWDANPHGCDHCRNGYKGRLAFHEVLEIDDEIRNALSNEKLEKEDLAKLVYSNGTISMLQDALIKCLEGKTSFEEVYRNIEIENEEGDNYESEMDNEIKNSIPKEVISSASDDLLETPINNSSEVAVPQSFTAEDFADKEKEEKSTDVATNTATETVNESSQFVPSVQQTSNSQNQEVANPVNTAIESNYTNTVTPSYPENPVATSNVQAPSVSSEVVTVPFSQPQSVTQQPVQDVTTSVTPALPVTPTVAATPALPVTPAIPATPVNNEYQPNVNTGTVNNQVQSTSPQTNNYAGTIAPSYNVALATPTTSATSSLQPTLNGNPIPSLDTNN